MKYILLLSVLSIASILTIEGQIPDSVKYISLKPHEFHTRYMAEDSSILIDVREPFEFKTKSIRGALNIPASGNLEKAADTLSRGHRLFLYCTSGYRSSRAAISLYDKGFRRLFNLEGGIVEWRKNGLPVAKGKVKGRTKAK